MLLQITSLAGVLLCLYAQNIEAIRGDATYYPLGKTACGRTYKDSDMVAAVGAPHWKGGNPNNDPICGRSVTVRDIEKGTKVTVQIQDKCEACGYNHIDLSPAAFRRMRPESVGRFKVEWYFN